MSCNRIQRFAGLDLTQRAKVLVKLSGYELFFFYVVSYTFYSEMLRRMKYGTAVQGSSFSQKTQRRLPLQRKAIIEGCARCLSRCVYPLFLRAFFTLLSQNLLKTGKKMSTEKNDAARLADILKELKESFDEVKSGMSRMGSDIDEVKSGMSRMERDMGERIGRLERTVGAIESFPVPYGRPKSYYSATSMHSVSGAVRRRQSYAG
jgi:hypothetical protein